MPPQLDTTSISPSRLYVSSPSDRYEQEADRIAARIGQTGAAEREHNNGPASSRGSGLDPDVRAYFEARLGHDFSAVRVHAGPQAARAADHIGARAFTVGRDIVFAGGSYAPRTASGRNLLAHELVHVVQQSPPDARGGNALAGTISRGAEGVIQRAVRHVACQSPTGRVRDIVGDDPLGTVRAADTRAIELLDGAISNLEFTRSRIRAGESASWPTIPDPLGMGLRDRFGLDPENRDIWTTNNRQTDAGAPSISLLLIRLRAVRRLLASGRLRYLCLNRPPCPPMSQPDEVVLGAEAFGECGGVTITLCEGFWRTNRSVDDRAMLLMHEAFHNFFCGTDTGRHMWNAHCIDQFVADVHGMPVTEGYETSCS